MRNKKKLILPILLCIVLVVAIVFGMKYFFLDKKGVNIDKDTTQTETTNKPTQKDSALFRDNLLGKPKANVLELLDVTEGQIIEENILLTNVETSLVFKNDVLVGIMSTVVIPKETDFDYARNHQNLESSINESTGKDSTYTETWKEGPAIDFSNSAWNKALKTGELTLKDKTVTHQGAILLQTSNVLLDKAISRPASEKIYQTIVVGTKEYVESLK